MNSITQEKNRDNRFIDLFKLFCSFLIVGIHAEPFADFGMFDYAFGIVTRIAVPFFFISSSFFLFRKDFSWKRIRKYCVRMAILYCVYSVIYLIADLINGTFVLNNFLIEFFLSGYKHLWFLHSSIISVLVISLFVYVLKREKLLYIISGGFYVLGLILFTYYPLFREFALFQAYHKSQIVTVIFERSWVFYGLPYMAIGYYFSKHKFIGFKSSIIGLIISVITLVTEGVVGVYLLHTDSTVLWMSVIPMSIFIFSLVASAKINIRFDTRDIRKLSTMIYCIHKLFLPMIELLNLKYHLVVFVVVLLLSILYGLIIVKLSKIKALSFLRYLY
ncbi:MAG: acyltransferase family protein [Ruminococcus sp.]|nr:acyltransferase family protein [Ruminococcus sp.]